MLAKGDGLDVRRELLERDLLRPVVLRRVVVFLRVIAQMFLSSDYSMDVT